MEEITNHLENEMINSNQKLHQWLQELFNDYHMNRNNLRNSSRNLHSGIENNNLWTQISFSIEELMHFKLLTICSFEKGEFREINAIHKNEITLKLP